MTNRIIKFRAWDTQRQRIVGVDILAFGEEKPYIIVDEDSVWNEDPETGEAECLIPMIDVELMQFTGLKDKNGKEIYFGDICKYEDESGKSQVGIVKDYGYFKGYIEAIGGDEEGNQDLELHDLYQDNYEVIGNIYENKELLI